MGLSTGLKVPGIWKCMPFEGPHFFHAKHALLFRRCMHPKSIRPPLFLLNFRLPLKSPYSPDGYTLWDGVVSAVRRSILGICFADVQTSMSCSVRFKVMVLKPFPIDSLMIRPPSPAEEGACLRTELS
ncbi:hypothetical protein V6N11_065317 [Hibiscus sabdariffa]|uniref:Uncharacterized protein n=1 Tax=Hibiscus sabdariffa TaxID=183260 RepID=A0ABR2QGJ7_9ROSI